MPRLAKGGKWVFGWVIVRDGGGVAIPPAAWREYGFRVGDAVLYLMGSRRSGGLAIGREGAIPPILMGRALGRGRLAAQGEAPLPPQAPVGPGDRLLAVRGSGHALGLLARGPIYDLALQHPEIETFA